MKIIKSKLVGVYKLKLDKKKDSRGFFTRLFCLKELKKKKISFNILQVNNSFNKTTGTFRGLHLQRGKAQESKIVYCNQGAALFVILDTRKKSGNFMQHIKIKISKRNNFAIHIPKGCASGYQTLKKNTEIIYLMDNFYEKKKSKTISIFDKKLKIKLPLKISKISNKDKYTANLK